MDARDLLIANLHIIDRVIAFTCRRQRLDAAEADEFASTVRLKLVENDYAIIRRFQGRSTFATFIAVVIHRLLLDYRIHHWGKFHASAEARRLGEAAVQLERLLIRDGRTIEEAFALLSSRDPSMTLDGLRSIAARLPDRPARRKEVAIDEALHVAAPPADDVTADRQRTSSRASQIVRSFIDALPQEDRLILQLRFDAGMTVAEIARSLQIDQKPLYRRIEHHLRDLRAEFERNGIGAGEAAGLIGDRGVILDFRLGNGVARPSSGDEEAITPGQGGATR